MALDVKYYAEWKDVHNLTWRVDIEQDGTFSPAEMKPMVPPLTVEFLSSSADIHQDPIKGSIASLLISSDTNFQWSEFFAVGDQQYRMSVYWNDGSDHLFWRGWVVSDNYSEPYDGVKYITTISASCGLGSLKERIYKYQTIDPDDTYYNGRRLESQIILDILGKIGITSFTEFINIYETNIDSGTGDSPLDQIQIDADVFKDMYCYEVLTEILNKYNAHIRLINGVMTIYRPCDLSQATVYGRNFTAATTKTSTTNTPEQFFNRTTVASDIMDVEGGTLMIKSPAKKVTINQDYGHKESWLDNWQFKQETFDPGIPAYPAFDYWIAVYCGAAKMPAIIPTEVDGAVITGVNTYPTLSSYIYQEFGSGAKTTSDILGLSFEYLFNYTGAGYVLSAHFYIRIRTASSSHYIYDVDGKVCDWNVANSYIDIYVTSIYPGNTGWTLYERNIAGLPADGPYVIEIYGLSDAITDFNVAVKNIKFYSPSIEVITRKVNLKYKPLARFFVWSGLGKAKTIKELKDMESTEIVVREYIKTNAVDGIELDNKIILGDVTDSDLTNVLEQFSGSLAYVTRESLALTASDFVDDHGGEYPGITVSHSGNDVIFTEADGNNFTGSTSIANVTGSLSGSVVNTQAHLTAVKQVETVTLTGTWGTANVTCGGVTKLAVFGDDLTDTAADFVTSFGDIGGDYWNAGMVVTSDGADIIFTARVTGTGFTGLSIVNATGDLNGTVANTAPKHIHNQAAQVRIDTVILSGSYGTANITCDAVTKGIDVDEGLAPTVAWNTRGGAEATQLLDIIAEELKDQQARPRQYLSLPVYEGKSNVLPHINLIGNFQDNLNQVDGDNRIFVFNKGTINLRDRSWEMDLIEII